MVSPVDAIKREIPSLRRYARALCGDADVADAYICALVERLDKHQVLLSDRHSRVELFRLLCDLCSAQPISYTQTLAPIGGQIRTAHKCLSALPIDQRHAILLNTLEDFSLSEVSYILNRGENEVARLISSASQSILQSIYTDILIIEDEAIVAGDLAAILRELGHNVLPVAANKEEAVRCAQSHPPGLILADVKLADDSSGVDAVNDIRSTRSVPTIFITAYPERLPLYGRPEFTHLVTKPYRPENVKGAVNRALFLAPC